MRFLGDLFQIDVCWVALVRTVSWDRRDAYPTWVLFDFLFSLNLIF